MKLFLNYFFHNYRSNLKKLIFVFVIFVSFLFSNQVYLVNKSYNNIFDKNIKIFITVYDNKVNFLDKIYKDLKEYEKAINKFNSFSASFLKEKYISNYSLGEKAISSHDPISLIGNNSFVLDRIEKIEEDGTKMNSENFLTKKFESEVERNSINKAVYTENFSDLFLDKIEIVEGRNFTKEEIEKKDNKAIMFIKNKYIFDKEKNTARLVKIGDKIPLSIYKEKDGKYEICKEIELEVIGFYNLTENYSSLETFDKQLYTIGYHIYLSGFLFDDLFDEVKKVHQDKYDKELKYLDTFHFEPAVYQIDNRINLIDFISKLKKTDEYKNKEVNYITSIDDKLEAISSISSLEKNFDVVSKLCFVLSPCLFILIFILDNIKKKKEIAYLISLNETKLNICLRYFLENLIIFILGFIFAFITINYFSSFYVQNFILGNIKQLDESFLKDYKVLNFNALFYISIILNFISLFIVTAISYLQIKKCKVRELLR